MKKGWQAKFLLFIYTLPACILCFQTPKEVSAAMTEAGYMNICVDNSNDDKGGSSGSWAWPFKSIPQGSKPEYGDGGQFGNSAGSMSVRGHEFHDGFDFSNGLNGTNVGSEVLAVHDGKVKKIGTLENWWYVWVVSDDGYNEVYQEAFMSKSDINVNEGDTVKIGDKIGKVSGTHLHLGISKKLTDNAFKSAFSDDGTWEDPVKVISEGENSENTITTATTDTGDSSSVKVDDENATGDKAVRAIAKAVSKSLNVKEEFVYAQLYGESGDGNSTLARNQKNFGGMRGSNGVWKTYTSLTAFAQEYAETLKNMNVASAKTIEEYAHQLKIHNYYEDDEGKYLNLLKSALAAYGGSSLGGTADAASGAAEKDLNEGLFGKIDDDDSNLFGTYGSSNENEEEELPKTNGVGGDWTNPSSESYKNAKAIFDFMTKTLGMSGAGAAGVVGNAKVESGFDPKASNGSHFGLFQWTSDRLAGGGFIKSQADWTVENELKLTQYELDNTLTGTKAKVGNATDPETAATIWEKEVERSGGQSMADRIANAKIAYEVFGGENISANSSLLDVAGAASSNNSEDGKSDDNTSVCQNLGKGKGTDSENDGSAASIAKSLVGYFKNGYEQSHNISLVSSSTDLKSISDVKSNGRTDCSGFVWLVLKLAGYKVPDNMGWYTKTMEDDAKGSHNYLKEVDASSAKAGDVAIGNQGDGAGNNGHTVILAENYHGDDTKVYSMGDDSGVIETTIGTSMGRFGGAITYATPQK